MCNLSHPPIHPSTSLADASHLETKINPRSQLQPISDKSKFQIVRPNCKISKANPNQRLKLSGYIHHLLSQCCVLLFDSFVVSSCTIQPIPPSRVAPIHHSIVTQNVESNPQISIKAPSLEVKQ